MRYFARVLRISATRRGLLLRSLLEVVRVRIVLTLRGYKNIAQPRPRPTIAPKRSPMEIAWAVSRVSRLVPGATCLTQAVAAREIMAKSGYATTIRIGVKADKARAFTAHAWLIHDDRIVLGGDEASLANFRVLTDLQPKSAE